MKGWKRIFQVQANQKRSKVAILIPDKLEFKLKMITRDNRSLYNDEGVNSLREYKNCKYSSNIGHINI